MPSLLLANPTLPLEALHLQHYTILDSEPLHDLKGHLFNLFSELPYILNGDVKETCQKIIKSNLSKEKVKCADLRLTAVHLYQLFLQHYRDDDYQLLLIQTYSSANLRDPLLTSIQAITKKSATAVQLYMASPHSLQLDVPYTQMLDPRKDVWNLPSPPLQPCSHPV